MAFCNGGGPRCVLHKQFCLTKTYNAIRREISRSSNISSFQTICKLTNAISVTIVFKKHGICYQKTTKGIFCANFLQSMFEFIWLSKINDKIYYLLYCHFLQCQAGVKECIRKSKSCRK
uniref:Uncharacterized protein n=1 Tax=Schistocephalus solidus TaxID=70667 RepID=A0A0V0J1K5_SCHSO